MMDINWLVLGHSSWNIWLQYMKSDESYVTTSHPTQNVQSGNLSRHRIIMKTVVSN